MSHKYLRVVARIIALPNKVEELKTVLSQLIEPTRQEAGYIQYELLQNQSDPTDFTFVETWTNQSALEAHLESAHLQSAVQKIEGLVQSDPDIRLYEQLF
ncbi:MAG: putative quinol monooxygenase [Microcystaceae cyanobacterium]